MNKVTGRVYREDGRGLGNLLVVLYQVDPSFAGKDFRGFGAERLRAEVRGARIASVATSSSGAFLITYKDEDMVHQGGACRPALLLVVLTPEGLRPEGCPETLHVPCEIRANAGRQEHYLIQISDEVLQRTGLEDHGRPAVGGKTVTIAAKEFERRLRDLDELRQRTREAQHRRWHNAQQRQREAEEAMGSAEDWLSRVGRETRESPRYVKQNESVVEKNDQAIDDELDRTVRKNNPLTMRGVETATPQVLAALKTRKGKWRTDMSGERFDVARRSAVPDVALYPGLERVDPEVYCRRLANPDEECPEEPAFVPGAAVVPAAPAGGVAAGGEGVPAPAPAPAGAGAVAAADLPQYLGAILNARILGAADSAAMSGVRADAAAVQSSVDSFVLRSGPADVTAEYEFHNLQIAFDHVWMEAFDQKVLQSILAFYGTMLDMGAVLPNAAVIGNAGNLVTGFARGTENPIPGAVVKNFEITAAEWAALPQLLQIELDAIATKLEDARAGVFDEGSTFLGGVTLTVTFSIEERKRLRKTLAEAGERIIYHARDIVAGRPDSMQGLHAILKDLQDRLLEPYAFTVFAATPQERSVNFGLLTTYRQRWQPVRYQAGELVATIPLAPKESRKFRRRTVVKQKRSEREQRLDESKRAEDSSNTSRGEAEIVKKAMTKSNFNLASDAGLDLGVFKASVKTGLSQDAEQDSAETKRDFREAVSKAAQEYRSERKVELSFETESETEAEESGEIVNPNDELTVTYLFYELQRRFKVSERIHRVTPVVLVAQEVPQPQQIDETWILSYDWIIRRVLLDQSLVPALDFISTRLVGDEHALEVKRKSLAQMRALVTELKEELVSLKEMLGQRYAALEQNIAKRAQSIESEASEGFFENIGEFFGGDDVSPEAMQVRETAARDAHENAVREERELRGRVDREVTALETASRDYSKLLGEHLNRKAQVGRLRIHIKQNLLYYMQAIWSYEPPDQRFFRLHRVEAPRFRGELRVNVTSPLNTPPGAPLEFEVECRLAPLEKATLSELADLDRLLGFKGNYMIFPLRELNVLTDFMMVPYVDAQFGLRDPDDFGNWTLEEFAHYICCLKRRMNPDAFEDLRPQLRKRYQDILTAPRRDNDEVIVPTGQLFIEALPGTHPLLEDFKLKHRAVDVGAAYAGLREKELENIRLAARILAGELDDPKIDKKVVIEGAPGGVVVGGPP